MTHGSSSRGRGCPLLLREERDEVRLHLVPEPGVLQRRGRSLSLHRRAVQVPAVPPQVVCSAPMENAKDCCLPKKQGKKNVRRWKGRVGVRRGVCRFVLSARGCDACTIRKWTGKQGERDRGGGFCSSNTGRLGPHKTPERNTRHRHAACGGGGC